MIWLIGTVWVLTVLSLILTLVVVFGRVIESRPKREEPLTIHAQDANGAGTPQPDDENGDRDDENQALDAWDRALEQAEDARRNIEQTSTERRRNRTRARWLLRTEVTAGSADALEQNITELLREGDSMLAENMSGAVRRTLEEAQQNLRQTLQEMREDERPPPTPPTPPQPPAAPAPPLTQAFTEFARMMNSMNGIDPGTPRPPNMNKTGRGGAVRIKKDAKEKPVPPTVWERLMDDD